jgi:hypothetical protein
MVRRDVERGDTAKRSVAIEKAFDDTEDRLTGPAADERAVDDKLGSRARRLEIGVGRNVGVRRCRRAACWHSIDGAGDLRVALWTGDENVIDLSDAMDQIPRPRLSSGRPAAISGQLNPSMWSATRARMIASDCSNLRASSLSSSAFRLIVTAVSCFNRSHVHHAIAANSNAGPRIVASRSALKEIRDFRVIGNCSCPDETRLTALSNFYAAAASEARAVSIAFPYRYRNQGPA